MVKVEINEKEIQALDAVFNSAKVNIPVASIILGFKQKIFVAWKAEKEALASKNIVSKKKDKK